MFTISSYLAGYENSRPYSPSLIMTKFHYLSAGYGVLRIQAKTPELLVLDCYVRSWLQADTGTEDVGKGNSMLCGSFDE